MLLMGLISGGPTLRLALFGIDSSVPPLVKADGCITHSSVEKVTLFADLFIYSKQSNEKLEIPLSCFPEPKLNSFAFRSSEIKNILLDLDSFGAVDPNGIFPLLIFFIKTVDFMAPKVSVVLCKLARMGSFVSCW